MKVTQTKLPAVLIIEPDVFGDARGWFLETFSSKRYEQAGLKLPFVQDNVSFSAKNVLRGLHFQYPHSQGKLVQVLSGEVFDVAVDIRVGSPTFGQWVGETLSASNHKQIYIPPGFAHGFCVLSDTALFSYKCTDYYNPADGRRHNLQRPRPRHRLARRLANRIEKRCGLSPAQGHPKEQICLQYQGRQMSDSPDKVIILGGKGMLGTDVAAECKSRGIDFEVFDLPEFDITNEHQLPSVVHTAQTIINCAAYTNVEKAETETELAFRVNAEAVGLLAPPQENPAPGSFISAPILSSTAPPANPIPRRISLIPLTPTAGPSWRANGCWLKTSAGIV